MSTPLPDIFKPYSLKFVEDLCDEKTSIAGMEQKQRLMDSILAKAQPIRPDNLVIRFTLFTYIARIVALVEGDIITKQQAKPLAQAIKALREEGLAKMSPDRTDIFAAIYHRLIGLAGEEIKEFEVGTKRDFLQQTVFRMAARDELFDLIEWVALMQISLISLLTKHPHKAVAAFVFQLDRYFDMIKNAFVVANKGAIGEEKSGLDRNRLAELVAFDGLLEDEYDSLASTDYLTYPAGVLASFAVDINRFINCSKLISKSNERDVYYLLQQALSCVLEDCNKLLTQVKAVPFNRANVPQELTQLYLWTSSRQLMEVLKLLAAIAPAMDIDIEDEGKPNVQMLLDMANKNLCWWEEKKEELLGKRDILLGLFADILD